MGKRGQITLFIILGVVVLFSFSFVLVLVSETTQQQLSKEEKQVITGLIESTALQQFVESCVEDALESGLVLLGEQGGNFLEGQYGVRSAPKTTDIDGKEVSALIATDILVNPPLYPCSINFLEDAPDFCRFPSNQSIWRFGRSNLPPLEGSSINSIQSQLERYVEGYTQNCVDFDDPQSDIGSLVAYNLTRGEPSARINFGENAVRAVVSFPVTIETPNEPISQLVSFSATEDVRFKKLYEAAEDAISKDITFSDFDLESDLRSSTFTSAVSGRKSFLRFYPLRSQVVYKAKRLAEKDFFSFNDSVSKIGNFSYAFTFARENRPPALFYVQRFASAHDIYDVLVIENESAHLILQAVDPDEDDFIFLVNSPLSGITLESSRVTFDESQVGYHNLTVSANDRRASDHQQVRILVDKKLKGDFQVDNRYPTVSNEFASIEDPLFINLSGQARSLDPFAEYKSIIDYFNPNEFGGALESASGRVVSDCIVIPGFEACKNTSLSIQSITQEVFSVQTQRRKGILALELSVQYNGFSQNVSGQTNIEVKQCLPHRNPEHPFPFPYNNFTNRGVIDPIDPFLADHACCNDDFSVASSQTECFANRSITCSPSYFGGFRSQAKIMQRFCDGTRGNVCLGQISRSIDSLSVCGAPSDHDACKAPELCSGVIPWGEVALGNNQRAWCYGSVGCEEVCTSEIVDVDGDGTSGGSSDTCGCTPLLDAGKTCKDLSTGESGTCTLILGVCSS